MAVVTRDRAHLLERHLLPSLRLLDGTTDVVVIDQSTGDETARLVEQLPGVHYLRSAPGLAHGRNAAVDATTAPLIAFTDDDVTLPPTWVDAIVAEFSRAADVGVVCGRATDEGGRLLPGREPGIYRFPEIPFALGSGYNFAFRRAALDAAGPFDERLGAGARFRAAEDSDMLYRILKAGWAVRCADHITVVHHDWRQPSDRRRALRDYGYGAGAQTAKHARLGDRTALRLTAKEIGRHVATIARSLLLLRPALAMEQVAWMRGLAAGMRSGYREMPAGADAAEGQRPSQNG